MVGPAVPRALRITLIGSGVGHVFLVIGLIVGTSVEQSRSGCGCARSSSRAQTVITTKLVRLGKERPKELLPRKPKAPPPPEKIAPIGKPDPAKQPEPKSLSSALERMKRASQEEVEGHPDGSPDGEVSSLTRALVGNKYATEIYACVKKHYAIEGLGPERVRGKQARVHVRVNHDGSFFDIKIEKSSGLKPFDRAVDRAVKRCGKVSAPPKEIAEQVRTDGIEFEFTL